MNTACPSVCWRCRPILCRRHPDMTISSLRLHALLEWPVARESRSMALRSGRPRLWGWMYIWEAARHVLALKASYTGTRYSSHRRSSSSTLPSIDLAAVRIPMQRSRRPIRPQSLYNCYKAERLLGWVHEEISINPKQLACKVDVIT